VLQNPVARTFEVYARTQDGRLAQKYWQAGRWSDGQVLAHEMGHGWLAGCPGDDRGDVDEEGICELVASWWLAERGGPFARHLLAGMAANSDPVYGEGFRLASRRAAGLTPAQVVEHVSRTGSLGRATGPGPRGTPA
jgi:hypothetical protein